MVETWESGDEPVDMAVGYSNREAAHAMTAELIRSGYRRIVFVNGPAEDNERARHRAEGYLAAMREAGLDGARRSMSSTTRRAILPETGAQAMRAMRAAEPAIDAVFFTSDVFAVGAILACRETGIAGAGRAWASPASTISRSAGSSSPALTTVHVPALEMGRKAGADDPVAARRQACRPARAELGFKIVARDSTRRDSASARFPLTAGEVTGNIRLSRRQGRTAPERIRRGTREEKQC